MRGAIRCQIWVLLALALLACSSPEYEPLPPDGVILAFGDSLTVGVGATRDNSYPSVLARLSGLQVINSGVSGETTRYGLDRLKTELAEARPDLLILAEGGNDILRNQDPDEIKANLSAMIELANQDGIPVVLLGIPEKKLFSDSAPLYRELAEEHQLVFDGELVADLLRTPSLKSDQIHLNAAGYRQMAEAIHELLIDAGLLN